MRFDSIEVLFTGFVGTLGALTLIGLFALVQPHKVRGYYISTTDSKVPCVKADIDWAIDEAVFCSDNVEKLGYYANFLNAQLGGSR